MNGKVKGFTLMELLVVLVILGLLAALVGPTVYQRIKPARQSVARAQIEHFMTALDSYFIDIGDFPDNQSGLQSLRSQPDGVGRWRGPYLQKNIPVDPWGNAYVYRNPGRNGAYEISSYGADGKQGGSDDDRDINSWEND